MSGNGIIVVAAVFLALYAGITYERARNAFYLVRRTKNSLGTLRDTARKELGRAALWIGIIVLFLYIVARNI